MTHSLLWIALCIGLFGILMAEVDAAYIRSLQIEIVEVRVTDLHRRDFTPKKGYCSRRMELVVEPAPDSQTILRINCELLFSEPFTQIEVGDVLRLHTGVDPKGYRVLLGVRRLGGNAGTLVQRTEKRGQRREVAYSLLCHLSSALC